MVNQGGASGSIGTRNVLQAPHDGYTWASGAAKDLGTYAVSGMLDTKIADWRLYVHVVNVSVLWVNPNSPYKTPQELVDAMKAKPGQVSVATAGVNSSGHAAIEAFTKALGVTYKHVTYDGGNPAVISTVSGETEVTTQLAVEQANMIRAKRLRPLAVLSDKPLELEGFGTIPPITSTIKGYKPDANYFGIFVPKDVPAHVLATLDMIWKDVIMKSEALKKYATANGAIARRPTATKRSRSRCRRSRARRGRCTKAASRRSRRTRSAFRSPENVAESRARGSPAHHGRRKALAVRRPADGRSLARARGGNRHRRVGDGPAGASRRHDLHRAGPGSRVLGAAIGLMASS